MSYAITGPVLRASGIGWDLRKAQPYSSYEDFDFDIPIGTNGDTFDRYVVRVEEMRQSIRIIRQAVEGLARGTNHCEGAQGASSLPPVKFMSAPRLPRASWAISW